MKLFISSRGINTLDITYLDALEDKGIEVYTDYETLMNNYSVIEKMIIKNNCTTCGGKTFIKINPDGSMEKSICPICNGYLNYNITLMTSDDHEDIIFDDDVMDHIIVKKVNKDENLDQAIIDECDNIVIICTDQDKKLIRKEYSLKTKDLGLILAYNAKKEGNN